MNFEREIDHDAKGKRIFALDPDIEGEITGIKTFKCPNCKKYHNGYAVTWHVGFLLTDVLCPGKILKMPGGYQWLRTAMKEDDEDYMFFGCPNKVLPTKEEEEIRNGIRNYIMDILDGKA